MDGRNRRLADIGARLQGGKTGRLTDQSKNASFRRTIRQVQFCSVRAEPKQFWFFGGVSDFVHGGNPAPHIGPTIRVRFASLLSVDPLSNSTPFARKVIEEF
jgi:hypothetical protein